MGIYIKGMEMPKDGFITITVTSDGRVAGNSKKENGKFEYLDNEDIATAVTIPPHGKLGDLDALYEKFSRLESEAMNALKTTTAGSVDWIKWSTIAVERAGYKQDIVDAPTIIPAEEGEA